MQEFLLKTYDVALPILLGYIVWLLKKQNKKRDANSQGTMILLQIKLIEYHDKYCRKGRIPSYVYKNFCNAYKAYHALGGNDMVTHMKADVDKLEMRDDDDDDDDE